jgi:hypothetical protein
MLTCKEQVALSSDFMDGESGFMQSRSRWCKP